MHCQQFIQLLGKSLARKPPTRTRIIIVIITGHCRTDSVKDALARSLPSCQFFSISSDFRQQLKSITIHLYLLSLSLGCCQQPTQISTRETKPLNNEWWSAKAHLHCRFSFEDVPEKKRKTVKILCRQDFVLNLHRLLLFCGRFSQRLNMWLLLFAMVLSWDLLLQRPAAAEEECLRSFLMCFSVWDLMGLLLLFLICAKDNGLLHFRMRWLHCVYVCVCFHLPMTHAYGMFLEILQKGNRHMMRSMMRACLSFSTNLSPSGSG